MFFFQVADPWVHSRPAFHPTPEAFSRSAATAFINMHLYGAGVIMAAVAHIHKHLLGTSGDAFYLLQGFRQGMAVIRIAVARLGSDKPTAPAGGGYGDFAALLVAFMGFAFADALYGRFMNTVDLIAVVSLLMKNAGPDCQQGSQRFIRMWTFAGQVTQHPPQIGL